MAIWSSVGARLSRLPAAGAWLSRRSRSCGIAKMSSSSPAAWRLMDERAAAGDVPGTEALLWETRKHMGDKTVVYNTLLKACANDGAADRATLWFVRMQAAQVRVNAKTFGKLTEAAAKNFDPETAKKWKDVAFEAGFRDEMYANMLIDASARSGDVAAAAEQFKAAGGAHDQTTYGSMLNACAKAGDVKGAIKYFKQMQRHNVKPTRMHYNAIIEAQGKGGQAEFADDWFQRMIQASVQPDIVSFGTLIDAHAKASATDTAVHWLKAMGEHEVIPHAVCYGPLINACAKDGRVAEAVKWFERMEAEGITPIRSSYNMIIKAHAKAGSPVEAAEWLDRLRRSGVAPPSVASYGAIIDAHARVGDTAGAQRWLAQMASESLQADVEQYTSLVNAHAKARDAKGASDCVGQMMAKSIMPNIITFKCAVAACGHARPGRPDLSEALLRRMVSVEVSPDHSFAKTAEHALGRKRFKKLRRELSLEVQDNVTLTTLNRSRQTYMRERLEMRRELSIEDTKQRAKQRRPR